MAGGGFTVYDQKLGRFVYQDGIDSTDTNEHCGRIYMRSIDVGVTGHAVVDDTGYLSLRGTATVWEDSMVPAVAFRSGLTALTFDAITTNLYGYRMDTNDVVHITVQMPHSMKVSTVIKPHMHIVNKAANVHPTDFNTKWTMTYCWANIGQAFGSEVVATPVTVSFQNTAALTHKLVPFGDITPSATQGGISSILIMAIGRVVADSGAYTGTDIYTLGFDIHYERDSLGSQEATSKT